MAEHNITQTMMAAATLIELGHSTAEPPSSRQWSISESPFQETSNFIPLRQRRIDSSVRAESSLRPYSSQESMNDEIESEDDSNATAIVIQEANERRDSELTSRPDVTSASGLGALLIADPVEYYTIAIEWKEKRAKEIRQWARKMPGSRSGTRPDSSSSSGDSQLASGAEVEAAQQELARFEDSMADRECVIDAALILYKFSGEKSMSSFRRRRGEPDKRKSRLTVKERISALAKVGASRRPPEKDAEEDD